MRVIVCGSRTWNDANPIRDTITRLRELVGNELVVVTGAAPGADQTAGLIAYNLNVTVEAHPADWEQYGRSAGPIRNREMLAAGAHLVVAFKDDIDHTRVDKPLPFAGRGTEDMLRIAHKAGVLWCVYTHTSGVIARSSFNALIVDAVDRWRNPSTLFEGGGT